MKDCRPVHVGVVGAGAISDIYLKNMTERFSILQVDAICSRNRVHAEEKAKKYGIRACTYEEMLAEEEIEMIVNLTPVPAHYEIIRRALEAGKHVYTEKVVTEDPAQAKELVRLAEAKGLYLGAAPDTFLGSALQTARKALDEGRIGTVTSCVAAANRNNDILLSLFSFLRMPGGGIAMDYGVYYLTALVSLLGPVRQAAALVKAPFPTHVNILPQSPEFGQVMDTPNESQVSAILEFESGITGTLQLNADSLMQDQAYIAIYGTKGILYLPDPNQFGSSVKLLTCPDMRNLRMEELPCDHAFSDNARGLGPAEMAWALREGRPNRASGELSCHVLEVLSALLESGEKGSFVTIESSCSRPEPLPVPAQGEEECLM